jgi:hypothetical protein
MLMNKTVTCNDLFHHFIPEPSQKVPGEPLRVHKPTEKY